MTQQLYDAMTRAPITNEMKKIWVNKAGSFRSAERFDEEYYLGLSRSERLEIIQHLREIYFKIKKEGKGESRKGLRRLIKIVQQI